MPVDNQSQVQTQWASLEIKSKPKPSAPRSMRPAILR